MTKPSSIRAARRVRSGSVFLIVLALAASSWLVVRAEIPQVASGTWVTAGQVGTIPTGAASVGLSDGRLLVAGGQSDGVFSSVVATYDPASGAWAAVGSLNVARAGHTATVLKDGRVLIAGGANADGPTFDIEIFNPSSGTSVHAGDMTLPRVDHAAATLKDGRVLIVGGSDGASPVTIAEVFDPQTGLSASLAAAMSTPRVKATATTLLDGHVLIAGGSDGTNALASAEIFESASGSFFATGAMQTARSGHVAVLLPSNNQVLISGGTSAAGAPLAELYADWRDGFAPVANQPTTARTGAIAGALKPYDLAFVAGGGSGTGEFYGYATVKTDKDDYQPGETVTISGSGWQPGETVTLRVTEDADTHYDWNLSAVANEQGQIVNREFYPRQDEQFQHLGMRFYVMATGAASQALTTFTDGALKIKSANGRNFDFTYQRFTDLNCTSGGGTITTETADANGFNLNTANGESWRIIANLNANAPNASSVFSVWSNPDGLTITPNLTSRTICVQGFQSGNKDLIGNYVANTPPVANNDAYSTNEDTPLTVTAPGVLANDTDANGNSLTAVRGSGTTGPSDGTLTFNADGSFTYTPNANFNGSDSFTYFANDGFANSNTAATVTITVNAVNDAPSFVKGPNQTVLEDAGAQAVTGWAMSISAGPANENTQTVTFTVTNDNNALFSVQPAISPTGTLTYAPAANSYGSATVTVTLSDNGGTANGGIDTSAAQTFTITVTPVNDAPSFVKGADQTVLEDAGPQTVAGWATSISAGPNETQTLTFTTSNNNMSLFSVQPAISATGTLTYTPAANANGSATVTVTLGDDGGTANGGVNTSAPQTFTITVTAVNDAPSFTKGANETVLEDSGARTVSNWATNISAGPPDENTQTVTFTATNDNNPLFSVQPAISSTGTLTYTPAANAFGSATVTVTLKDNGGTANGGADTSAPQTFTITVLPVNDAPSFTKGSDQTVNEDAGAQTVTGWATAISAGPANESSQTVTFVVNSNNSALFSAGPAVDSTGTLTYTPAANANGSATVTIHAQDNGGTANSGVDVSPTQTFVITVTAVNDPPSFTKGANQTVLEDAPAQTVAGWATAISAGPADESTQTLTFTVNNDNNALFSVQPALSPTGTLTYTPAANAYGTATITVYLMDNGGTANGGDDTSDSQTFTITVLAVNDAPSFTKGADQTVLEDAGPQTVTGWATAISAGPANESSQTVSFVVTSGNPSLFSSGPAVDSTGTLTYTPAVNANGSATVTIYAKDDGGTANGGVDISPTQTFVINVTAVNDPPTFTKGADQTVLEDSGAHTVAGWATAISAGPPDESTQTVTFLTSNNNPSLFSAQPAVASDGTLTYAVAANAFGSATVTVTAKDNGGIANGGVDTSAPQTFTINVTPINDAPSFTKGADQTVLEDAGPQTATGWATAISAGPNEGGQTVQFLVTGNTNPSLFSAGPAVDSTGTLTYTPAAEANGGATITIVLKDDGGTANGGADTSGSQTFVINVTAVNDAPSFTAGANQTVAEDSGPQTVPGWATGISAGPADESGQTVSFLTSNNNPALFSVQPSVAPNGTLTYTSAPNAFGSATVTVRAKDNGGTANGGADTSAAQTFTITVTSVNDVPDTVTVIVSPASINENSGVTASGSFTDPDVGDTHAVTIYWGDGATTVLALAAGTFTYYASHQYLDDNPTNTAADTYAVYVTVTDNGSPQGVGSTPAPVGVTVSNLAPVISTVTGPAGPQSLGTMVSVAAAFTDVGSQDTHTCTVTWDDSTTSYGTVTETLGNGSCTASHLYAAAGVYSVKVTVKDDDTGTVTKAIDSDYIVIFDPNGGFVTGGGFIDSPAGASVDYPTMTGKANFGFVSKYKKGSNTPEGETEFQFKAGDLNFHGSVYDYGSLVISGGKAQYRGTGEVNGVAGYRFVLTAYDGQGPGGNGIDRFRIKITRNGSVVYDNRMGASDDMDLADPMAIAGGSIVIHK